MKRFLIDPGMNFNRRGLPRPFFRSFVFGPRFYEDGAGGGGGGGAGDGAGGDKPPEGVDQETYDRIFNKGFKKASEKADKLQRELLEKIETLQKGKSLSDQEKDKLQKEIEDLEGKVLSADEAAARAADRTSKELGKKLDTANARGDLHERLHKDTLLKAEILSAASKHKAYSPDQILPLVKDKIDFEPRMSEPDGKGVLLGYDLKMKLTVPKEGGADGETEEKIVDVDTGIKLFLEQPENRNLVSSTNRPGSGSGNRGGAGDDKFSPGSMIPESKLLDPTFVLEHQNEVAKAIDEGRIIKGR